MTAYAHTLHDPVLQVKSVNLTLGGKRILRDMSFTIRDVQREGHNQGQVVALLGPSGVGKTQLFRRIAGLDAPDSGEILVGLKARPTQPGLVGVVMQHYPLFMHRTVLGNLQVAGRQAGMQLRRATEKAEYLLSTFSLLDRKDAWPAELSGGQRQRVAIAQQLMCSEPILLMDEPFSGLDPVMKQRACDLIRSVAAMHEENTIVIVTHDIEAAVHVCDQILVIGRDPDKSVPGAFVRADFDLKERGVAWRLDNENMAMYAQTVREIKALFPTL